MSRVALVLLALLVVASENADANGDATDPFAIRGLLAARDWDALEGLLDRARERDRAAPASEAEQRTFRAFRELTPHQARALDAWIAERPDVAPPRIAQAEHLLGEAWVARGDGLGSQIPLGGVARMRELASGAIRAATEATGRDPQWMEAWTLRIEAARLLGDPDAAVASLEGAIAEDPAHYGVRREYARGLAPRWGGSPEALDAFVEQSQAHADVNPHLHTLLGAASYESAWQLGAEGRHAEALAAVDRALLHGEEVWFLYRRAAYLDHLERYPEALETIERAIALDPWRADLHDERGRLLALANRPEEALAARDLAVRLAPRNQRYRRAHAELSDWFRARDLYESYQRHPVATRIYRAGLFLERNAAMSALLALALWAGWRTRDRWGRRAAGKAAPDAPLAEPAPFTATEAAWLLMRAYAWVMLVYQATDSAYDRILGNLESAPAVAEAVVVLVGLVGALAFAHRVRLVAAELWKVWAWLMPTVTLFVQFGAWQMTLADWPNWAWWHGIRLPAYVCLFLYAYRSGPLWSGPRSRSASGAAGRGSIPGARPPRRTAASPDRA